MSENKMDDIENKMNDLITEIDNINELGDFSEYFKLEEKYNNDDVKKMITEKVKGLIKIGVGKAALYLTIIEILDCKGKTKIVDLLECLKKTRSYYFKDFNLKKKLKNIKKESIEEYEKTYKNSDTDGGKRRNRKSKKGKKSRKARKSRRKSNRRR
jgi:hypothetical protein